MANLYSVIPGLSPSTQEIIEAELVAKQVLEGKYPDLDLREGTGLRDLVLRPTAYAFALLKKATDYYFDQNTLASANDSTPEEVVDDLLSNWFLTRNVGTKAVISARLFFARSKNVTLTADIGFSPDNTLYFFPESSQAYPADVMSYDAYSNEWYIDVPMAAASTGTEYNLSEGSLLYFSTFDPYFLRAEINYLISESSPAETNTQFIARAGSAISTRNLINIPSIESKVKQTFNYISDVVVVGAGDVDMVRDMVRVYPETYASVTPLSASISGTYVTFSLPGHSFQVGQSLVLSDALPEMYNGQYVVASSDPNNITLYIPYNPGYISVLPGITRNFDPVYLHNGGAVDIFCGKRVGTSIIQVTTNDQGIADVYGPVYSVKRSQLSGGDLEDTIPYILSIGYSSHQVNSISKSMAVIVLGTSLFTGAAVSIEGLDQYQSIQSATCVGTTVVATTVGSHSIQEGDVIRVSGATPDAYNGTYTITSVQDGVFTYTVPFQISSAASGLAIVHNPKAFSAPEVTDVNGFDVTISLPYLWSSAGSSISGTMVISQETPFTQYTPYDRVYEGALVTVVADTAIITMNNHGVSSGRKVHLSCPSLPALTGYWKVASTPTGSSFTLDVTQSGIGNSSVHTASVTYIENSKDYGFSMQQQLRLDFGPEYANSTASFEISQFPDLDSIQEYLNSPDNKVVCGNYLAKGFNLTFLEVEVVSYDLAGPDTLTVQLAVEDYLSSLSPGSTFVLSDLVSSLYTRGVTNIKTPVGVKYTRYTRDLSPPETGVILDYLEPFDKTNVFLLKGVTSTATPL